MRKHKKGVDKKMKKHRLGKYFVNAEGENRSRMGGDDFMSLINRIPPEKRNWDNPLYFECMMYFLLFDLKRRVEQLEGKTPKPKKKEKQSDWLLEAAEKVREKMWKEHPIC